MSALLDQRGNVIADHYLLLADDAPVPAEGCITVSLARWQVEREELAARTAAVAVILPNTADVLTLDSSVLSRPMLVLDFPTFADGRAYSQAHCLRKRCRYTGTLRAFGAAVVADQLAMMVRSDIDQLQLRADQNVSISQLALTVTRRRPEALGG